MAVAHEDDGAKSKTDVKGMLHTERFLDTNSDVDYLFDKSKPAPSLTDSLNGGIHVSHTSCKDPEVHCDCHVLCSRHKGNVAIGLRAMNPAETGTKMSTCCSPKHSLASAEVKIVAMADEIMLDHLDASVLVTDDVTIFITDADFV